MNRILLICRGNTSQTLAVTPALTILRRNFPKAHITVLASQERVDIFKNNPSVDEVWPFAPFGAQLKQIKAGKFNLAVLFTPTFKMALLTLLGGVQKRIAPHNFYTDNLVTTAVKINPDPQTPLHQKYVELLAPLFVFTVKLTPKLYVSKRDDDWAQKYLQNIGILPREKFVCINPSSPSEHLNWPKENYAAFIDKITTEYPSLKVVLICHTKKEINTAQEIYWRSIRKPYILRDTFSLTNFISILNRAAVVVSNYSAPSHIAAALGKPVIAFFPSLEDSNILKPYGTDVTVLEPQREKCLNCDPKNCFNYCLKDIGVDKALTAFDKTAKKIITGSNKVLCDDAPLFG